MSVYLELDENGLCTNALVCEDPGYAQEMSWVGPVDDLDPQPGIGWKRDDSGEWIPPPPPEEEPSA